AMIRLYRDYRAARSSAETLAEQVSSAGGASLIAQNPTEEVNDLLQRHGNHFPQLEEAAEALWQVAPLDFDDVYSGLVAFLKREHGIDVRVEEAKEGQAMRRYDEKRGLITMSEVLAPRTRRFQLAHQVGLITQSERFE